MSGPKPFQVATAAAALATLGKTEGKRRFLVADEVGLGKTVVAREVARCLFDTFKTCRRSMTIYYIANGHSVSYQNKSRLVGFLDSQDFTTAIDTPDRLSLIAQRPRPDAALLIYALTPLTSFPGAKARITGGRKEERAFVWSLLERAYPAFARQWGAQHLQLSAQGSWEWTLEAARERLDATAPGLCKRFRLALAEEFGVPVRDQLDRCAREASPRAFADRLRRALVLAALRHQPPDLVVFDEFQRYRALLDGPESHGLMAAMLEPEDAPPPAVLLLSATPYPHLTTRWQETQGVLAHAEMLKLVAFLGGESAREKAAKLFARFGDGLRDIAAQAASASTSAQARIAETRQLRDELRQLLMPLMSRTERESVGGVESLDITRRLCADPVAEDFRIFRHLKAGFTAKARHEALPYWGSVPLPAQSLGPQYHAWRSASFQAGKSVPQMTRERRSKGSGHKAWPDAKLRALQKLLPAEQLALPWAAPSLPWWPLGGRWKSPGANPDSSANPKMLMFSRFRATPPSVTALLSLGVEERYLPRGKAYEKVYRKGRLKLSDAPGPVMAAFHPSIWLIRKTDPLARPGRSLGEVRKAVRKQIIAALPAQALAPGLQRRHRSIGVTLAALDRYCGDTETSVRAWQALAGDDKAAQSAIAKWQQVSALSQISPRELDDLVDYAIAAPGVILGRALYRHDRTILERGRFAELLRLSWLGLRSYLDNPVFLATDKKNSALAQVMTATLDGGLESLLDEHFWLRVQGLPDGSLGLVRDLQASLGLRAGSFGFHPLDKRQAKVAVRCHVAVPFGNAESEPSVGADGTSAQAARPDEIRQSFNTPFWPHVLATTSVGQEGLDFHPWCSRVLHWDLPSNPLDLEQREGRVQRYAGLAVRRELARRLGKEVLGGAGQGQGSPWYSLEQRAKRLEDGSGLRPWWVLEQAAIERYIFERPFGRDNQRFERLKEQRLIYRLALGQPNQEDFLDILAQGGEAALEALQPLVLDLSAMGLRNQEDCAPCGRKADAARVREETVRVGVGECVSPG
ncbi:helicase-related protein [Pseudomonas wadenswilerensis]